MISDVASNYFYYPIRSEKPLYDAERIHLQRSEQEGVRCAGIRVERRGDSFHLVFASLELTWDEYGEWTLLVGDSVKTAGNSTQAAVHGVCGNNNGKPLGRSPNLYFFTPPRLAE